MGGLQEPQYWGERFGVFDGIGTYEYWVYLGYGITKQVDDTGMYYMVRAYRHLGGRIRRVRMSIDTYMYNSDAVREMINRAVYDDYLSYVVTG